MHDEDVSDTYFISIDAEKEITSMNKRYFSTRNLVCMAMLAALSVILARLIIPMPAADVRYSIEAVPMAIAGILFGPFAGGIVGFVADLVGCLFSGYGWNPLFAIPPILYGVVPGLLRFMIAKEEKPNFVKILVMILIPAIFGSILWQSLPLSLYYGVKSGKGYWVYVLTRIPQFAVTAPIDSIVIWLLFKTGMFRQLRYWPNADYIDRLNKKGK